MINDSLLILGAGASVEFGYPTGKELFSLYNPGPSGYSPEAAIACALRQESGKVFEKTLAYCKDFLDKKVNYHTDNIDQFLRDLYDEDDPEKTAFQQEIGKFLIALRILSCENSPHKSLPKALPWLSHIVKKILHMDDPSRLLENNLRIITFNYDVSVEFYLYKHLLDTPRIKKFSEEYLKLLHSNIIHMYGAVRAGSIKEIYRLYGKSNTQKNIQQRIDRLNKEAKEAINNLQVIYGEKHLQDPLPAHVIRARDFIRQARNIYLLGFGFDEMNLELLGFKNLLQCTEPKNIYYTNYDQNKIIDSRVKQLFKDHEITCAHTTIEEALSKDFEVF